MSNISTKPPRLLSLDALRGFDMFWIIGGEEIFHVLAKVTGWAGAIFMAEQFTHVEWNGFRPYDLIFPLFLFMAGVSTPFSLAGQLAQGQARGPMVAKILRRGFTLVLLGIVYNNGLQIKPLEEMRFASVLGRIGLAGMFAQLIYVFNYDRPNRQYAWLAGLLLGYWALMMLVPVPGCGAGILTMECNFASYVDRLILPGRFHRVIHDPEGLMSTMPAIGTGLLGVFAGNLLKQGAKTLPNAQKVRTLLLAGVACLAVGWVWGLVFPINKNIWTSSFTLFAGGWSILLLTLFYWVIDLRGYNRWAWVGAVIGTNSILIYLAQHLIDFDFTANALFQGVLKYCSEPTQEVLQTICYVLVEWLFLYFLYRKKVFLKV